VLVTRKIPHLLGGVSQLPPDLRGDYHVKAMENMMLHPSLGVVRRPPTQHVAAVPLSPVDSTLFHEFILQSKRYVVVGIAGDLKVFDATTGAEATVLFPDGQDYLFGELRAVTAGDRVVIANRSATVEKDTTTAPAKIRAAVFSVRSGNFGTRYAVTINGVTAAMTTPTDTDPAQQPHISTTNINSTLQSILRGNVLLSDFDFYDLGSSTYVVRRDGADFTMSATDGEGDDAIIVVKDTVRSASDLPEKALNGMVVKVLGDPSSAADDYYVRYTTANDGTGAWRECANPGGAIALKASTMPWGLTPGGTVKDVGAQGALVDADFTFVSTDNYDISDNYINTTTSQVSITLPDQVYPAGAVVTMYVLSTTHSYTVLSGDTRASIITALAALFPTTTNYTTTTPAPETIQFDAATGVDLYFSLSMTLPARTFYNTTLTMTPSQYVGYVLLNKTSGAKGTIASNTATLVVLDVSGFVGGTRSTLLPGDECKILTASDDVLVCAPLPWRHRAAGDEFVVTFPSFVGRKVDEVFFYQGRLGISAGDSNVLSAAGDILQFFRKTATALLPDDVIDVRQANREAASYHSAALCRDAMYLFTESGANSLTGVPVLTPATVRLDPVGQFTNATIRPAVAGDSLFVTRNANGFTRVSEMIVAPNTDGRVVTNETTNNVPAYIAGSPRFILGDGAESMVVVSAGGSLFDLYVYSFLRQPDGSTVGSWCRWTIPGGQVINAVMSEGDLLLLMDRSGSGFIERINVSNPESFSDFRDRQGLVGSEIPFDSSVTLHEFYRHHQDNTVDTSGVLTVRKMEVFHTEPSTYTVTVAQPARTNAVTPSSTGGTDVSVFARNTAALITLASVGAAPMRISSLEWRGTYTNWSKRG
jgi:hypothetical protein